MTTFDWPSLMRIGLHELRLPPEVFWDLTPVELQIMMGARSPNRPLLSDGLAALMGAYPDENGETRDG